MVDNEMFSIRIITGNTVEKKLMGIDWAMYRLNKVAYLSLFFIYPS